jgi:acetyl esterase/lipase
MKAPDPRLADPFALDPVAEETAAFVVRLEAQIAQSPPVHTLAPKVIRDAREAGRGLWGPIVRSPMAVDREMADVPVRCFVPPNPRGVYLHLHGGGWMLGGAHHHDPRNEHIARACGLAVVSVGYRLAPEHPYPAAPDDCEAVARWLVAHSVDAFGTGRIAVGGESAGAHLALVTLLRLRDRHGYSGFTGANLTFGAFDLSGTPSQRRWGARDLVLSGPTMKWFYDAFVPEALRRDPDVSPLYADLAGLPPAMLTVGTLDPLLDDSLFLYTRWRAAGNEAELAVYPGAPHGFTNLPIAAADAAHARIDAFLLGL